MWCCIDCLHAADIRQRFDELFALVKIAHDSSSWRGPFIDGELYLLRLADGTKLWSFKAGDEISSPAVIERMILVGSEDGTVIAFGPPGNAVLQHGQQGS